VEEGARLAAQAGASSSDMLGAVQGVHGIMSEIAAASREQSHGIAQVNLAVTQMDEVTQQNAALVEESAAASGALQSQAQQLEQAMALFKLERRAATAAPTGSGTARPAPKRQKALIPAAVRHRGHSRPAAVTARALASGQPAG